MGAEVQDQMPMPLAEARSWAAFARVVRLGGFIDQVIRVEAGSVVAKVAYMTLRVSLPSADVADDVQQKSSLSATAGLVGVGVFLCKNLTVAVGILTANEEPAAETVGRTLPLTFLESYSVGAGLSQLRVVVDRGHCEKK